jgi:3-oxoadipate enol-lactonase
MWNTTNDLKQYYTDRGNIDGIPVIFVHGFPFDHTMWDTQMSMLPEYFRPIAYDLRGHGLSEVGTGHYSLEFFVDDLFSLIKHLGIEKPVVCGLSIGGYILLRAVERNPDAFRAMILCNTRSEGDTNTAKIKRASAMKTVNDEGVEKYIEESIKNLFWEANLKNKPEAVEKIRTIIKNTSPLALNGTLMALAARTDTSEALHTIKVPTLIMVGEHDGITPPIAAESLHERIGGSILKVIKNAAHLSNLENPGEFNANLAEFLENVR